MVLLVLKHPIKSRVKYFDWANLTMPSTKIDAYSGTHEESEKMKCFYLDHNSKTNSPID